MNARIAYYLGHFEGPFSSSTDSSLKDSIFAWKCSIKARASNSSAGAVTSLPPSLPQPLKLCSALWSKAVLSPLAAMDAAAWHSALEAALNDPSMDEESIEAVQLMAVELFIGQERFEEAFSVLKRMKASSIDGQAYFVHLLCAQGNHQVARSRLQKMRSIPSWSSDICFMLAELSIALCCDSSEEEFGLKEALYSVQELSQLYGQSARLAAATAAIYALMGKFGDAQAVFSRAGQLDADGGATECVISVHLSGDETVVNCSIKCCKEHKLKCVEAEEDKETSVEASNTDTKDTTYTKDTTETKDTTDTKDITYTTPSTEPSTATTTTPSTTTTATTRSIQNSPAIQSFLSTHPYLHTALPVLLTRIQHLTTSSSSTSTQSSALAKEQEREERIVQVLKETLEVDPEVAALYDILLGEGFI